MALRIESKLPVDETRSSDGACIEAVAGAVIRHAKSCLNRYYW